MRNEQRRRFLRGGVGAAPILMTLASRSVLANGPQCFTPSGFISMPTSRHGTQFTCLGLTPGYWKQPQHFSDWPSPPYFPIPTVVGGKTKPATTFNSVFGTPSPYSSSTTLLDVLETMGGPPDDVGRHVAAELLNIKTGRVTVLSIPQLIAIWRSYINTGGGTVGYFQPTAGVKWLHDDIVNYLLSTMTL